MFASFESETAFVITICVLLVGLSLTIHTFFMFLILRSQLWLRRGFLAGSSGMAWMFPSILLATVFIAVSSFIQVLLWGLVLWHLASFDSFVDAIYLSGTTYTTLGTAKHVLVPPYRALEPMEAATGMLASGLNTAVLFAVLANTGRKHSDFEEFFR